MRDSTYWLILAYVGIFFAIITFFPSQFYLAIPVGLLFLITYKVVLPYIHKRGEEEIKKGKISKETLAAEKQEWQTKAKYLVGLGIVTAILYWFLPPWVNAICYFIPLIAISVIMTKEDQTFNFTIFFVGVLIFFLIPSVFGQSLAMISFDTPPPFFSLDVSIPTIEIPAIGNLISNFNNLTGSPSLRDFVMNLQTIVATVRGIVFIIIPAALAAISIYVGYTNPALLPKIILKSAGAALIIGFFAFAFPGQIFSTVGLETLAVTGENGMIHQTTNTLYSMLPFIISLIAITIGYLARYSNLPVLMADREERVKEKWNINMDVFHWGMFGILIIIVLWGMARFLSATDAVGFGNAGVLALFIVITVVASFPVLFGKFPIAEGTKGSNVTGILLGIAALMLAQQAITAAAYGNDMLSFALDVGGLWGHTFISVGDTMLFTAVTESLLFHITIPSLMMIFIYRRIRSATQRQMDIDVLKLVREREIDIRRKETMLQIIEDKGQLTQEILQVAPFFADIAKDVKAIEKIKDNEENAKKKAYLRNEIEKIEEETLEYKKYLGRYAQMSWGRLVFSEWKYTAFFLLLGVVVPNIIFAFYHWFRSGGYDIYGNLLPPQNIILWLSEGPFFVFIVSGMILTLIGFKYGWYSAIFTHGVWNAMIIMISAVVAGGLQ